MKQIYKSNYFFSIQSKIARIPFTQSKAWYNYINNSKHKIVFFVNDINDVKITAWGKK